MSDQEHISHNRKKKIRKTAMITAIYAFLVIVICFSAYRILIKLFDYRMSAETYRQYAERYTSYWGNTEEASIPVPEELPRTQDLYLSRETKDPDTVYDDGLYPLKTDFDRLLRDNPDVIGWICLPDSKINYPVVIADDNDYYLHRRVDGEYSYGGTIFMDTNCMSDWSSRNSILYGHNMNDGSMFAELIEFKKQETYDRNPYLYLDTPDRRYRLDIFSGFVTDPESEAYRIIFTDEDSFVSWCEDMSEKSLIVTDDCPLPTSRIVTLSTCTYEHEDARYVLMAVLRPVENVRDIS